MAQTRRTFIKGAALAGAASCFMLPSEALAALPGSKKRAKLPNGAVILFQGDSITDGNRGRDADPNHIMGHGYAFSVASRLGADFPEKKYNFINRGISGNKVIDLEKRWKTDVLDLKPDLLSILIGVNDSASVVTNWKPEVNVADYETIYRNLLSQTRVEFPQVRFVFGEPFIQSGSRTKDRWEPYVADIQARQAIVRKLASEFDAILVEFQHVFDQACSKYPVEYWIWDGVHPTVAGHELMTREWLKQVGKNIQF
jgi:lysophospholipase L1-like esterase